MEFVEQALEKLLGSLSALEVDWEDDVARRAIEKIESIPIRQTYTAEDITALLDDHFADGLLVCRLFLSLSKDELETQLKMSLGSGGIGVQRFQKSRGEYLDALVSLGLLDAMAAETNREPKWSDVLVERLRSGRGKAIRGQKRGRGLEDFVEGVIEAGFGQHYEKRCQFTGPRGEVAKCDFAIPDRRLPRILIEAKGYGATGSKMSDIIGDLDAIIRVKRNDTTLLFFTDGLSWARRQSDLGKIIERQNRGEIARIYTRAMREQLAKDLEQLKVEYQL